MGIGHLCGNHHQVYSIKIADVLSPGGLQFRPRYLVMHGDGRWTASAAPDKDGPAIDLTHTFAAPALYDAHVHLYDGIDLRAFTRYGICRVRDLGSPPGVAAGFARPAGCRAWPEVIFGGPVLDQPGNPRLESAHPWREERDLRTFMDQAAAQGASWLKVYARFPRPLLPRLVTEARGVGLRVAAHVRPADVRAALAAGVDEIEHLAPLIGVLRPTSHQLASVLDAWSGSVDETALASLRAILGPTALCPTLAVHRRIIDIAGYGRFPPGSDPVLTEHWMRLHTVSARWSSERIHIALRAYDNMTKAMGWLKAYGAAITIGSDTPNPGVSPGIGLWDEINLLAQTGISPVSSYLMASVSSAGMDAHGNYDLAFLPRDVVTGLRGQAEWPVRPVSAVTRNGCLFMLDDTN